LPRSGADFEAASRSEAVALFAARARAVDPSFRLDERNVRAVASVCVALDGLPLALELAAARTAMLPVAELARRLERRLPLLSGGARDLPARQQTLRATIDWSYELLTPAEQRLLAELAVFAGGFALADAVAICHGEPVEVEHGIGSLLDKNLLLRRDGDGSPRFAMLETIREYALERLREDLDEAAVGRRHAEYFVELAVGAEPQLRSTAAAPALERLDPEHDNLRAALAWSLEHKPDACVRLVHALYLFWYIRGHYREGLHWYRRALTVVGDDPSARARMAERAGALAFACREFSLARSLINEALPVYREVGDRPNTVRGLTLLGLIATNTGEHDKAVALLDESTALARDAGDANVLAFALANLGYAALTARDLDRAYAASLEAVELQQAGPPERRNLSALGAALGNLGVAALLLGRQDEARRRLAESVTVRAEIRDALGLASAFTALAAVAAEDGAFTRAARLLGAVDAVRDRTDAELEPIDAELYERTEAAARRELGDEAFARERAAGRSFRAEEAAELALAETDPDRMLT
jgi:tetratricopeptide (TPR) repeat protein